VAALAIAVLAAGAPEASSANEGGDKTCKPQVCMQAKPGQVASRPAVRNNQKKEAL
jgi:hypothetical protein